MKGFAHIGAMQALEERGIVPTTFAGTSIGALLGAARVAGMSMLQDINRASYRLDPEAFAAHLVAELEKSGVARREGDHLVLARA